MCKSEACSLISQVIDRILNVFYNINPDRGVTTKGVQIPQRDPFIRIHLEVNQVPDVNLHYSIRMK